MFSRPLKHLGESPSVWESIRLSGTVFGRLREFSRVCESFGAIFRVFERLGDVWSTRECLGAYINALIL